MKMYIVAACVLVSTSAYGQSLEEIDASWQICKSHMTITQGSKGVPITKWEAGWESCVIVERAWWDSERDIVLRKKENADKARVLDLSKQLEKK